MLLKIFINETQKFQPKQNSEICTFTLFIVNFEFEVSKWTMFSKILVWNACLL